MPDSHRSIGHPPWWGDYHRSAWERLMEALRRDWEQTKADLTASRGQDLHQGALDTVKQALGLSRIPLFTSEPTEHPVQDHWYHVHRAVRYGYGSYLQYDEHEEWSGELESKLQAEWEEMKSSHRWDSAREHVVAGWQAARAHGRPPNC